jgi:hypothetical protein
MTRNWTPRDALIEVLTEHLYVCAPGEVEARRIIKAMADEMLQAWSGAGYGFVVETDLSCPHDAGGPNMDRAY